jgi:hypothetical protein
MAVASWMRVFRACPVPGGRRLAGLPWIEISESLSPEFPGRREKRREFRQSALFFENMSRKHLRIPSLEDEFPTRARREYFRARRECREFGAKSIRPFCRIQLPRRGLVQPAIFAPLETASRLTPSPRRVPRLDIRFRGHDTCRLGYSSSLRATAQRTGRRREAATISRCRLTRACPHLSQASAQINCKPAEKLRAVFS